MSRQCDNDNNDSGRWQQDHHTQLSHLSCHINALNEKKRCCNSELGIFIGPSCWPQGPNLFQETYGLTLFQNPRITKKWNPEILQRVGDFPSSIEENESLASCAM